MIFSVSLYGLKIVFAGFVDNSLNFTEMIENIFLPNTLMWYLWVLAIYYLVFDKLLSINSIAKSRVAWGGVFFILLFIDCFQKFSTLFFSWKLCLGNLSHCAVYFYAGILIAQDGEKHSCFTKKEAVVSFVYILFFAVICRQWMYMGETSGMGNFILEECNAIAVIIFIFYLFQNNIKDKGILSNLGKQSLVIYLLHTYFVTALKVVFVRSGFCTNTTAVVIILVTSIVPVMITYEIAMLRKKVRVLDFIFHPVKK